MEMFRFAHIEYLYALAIIPVLIILFWMTRRQRRKALERFGQKEIISQLMPNVSQSRPVVKFIIWLLAISAIIVGIAQPQFGSKLKTVKREGVELIIALDVSNSMLAEDIQPNRLERSKRAISRLVDNLTDDKIGLIVFAGDAYTQLPITSDYPSAKLFLTSLSSVSRGAEIKYHLLSLVSGYPERSNSSDVVEPLPVSSGISRSTLF